MTQYIFFSGKGGSGKTTMAAATAVHYALSGERTLIVTTDPASNLADVFEQKIGHGIIQLDIGENVTLDAMEIDPDEATREYKEAIIGPFREMMPDDVIASLDENLSGPCTTEMASFDRFIDFMGTDDYDIIVFDTAPTGHTIRLLELPVDWSKHIEESARGSGQTCLGPVQSIQDSKNKYDRATRLLKDPGRTSFIFVMKPDALSLFETKRASRDLESIGIRASEIIINGILDEGICEMDFFRRKLTEQQKVLREINRTISKPKRYMFLKDSEIKGIDSLKIISDELFGRPGGAKKGKPGPFSSSGLPDFNSADLRKPDLEKLFLPKKGTKAIFFTGKGGVGKTTISCITAMYTAQKGFDTLIVTTDPAAHIGEVFNKKINDEPTELTDNLSAVMIDQETAFIEYRDRVLDEARGRYSEDMLAAMEEELNSPCIEEMASFDKFIRYIESRVYDIIVFDTAPTGHTLRLLDLPFDYAKQAEMMISTSEALKTAYSKDNRFKKIIKILRDKRHSVFCLVLYPESTPVLESHRAMLDMKEAGIETQLIVANMVLPEEVCTNDFFMNRRRMQLKYLNEIKEKFDLPVLVYPMVDEEIKGIDFLKSSGLNFGI